MTGRTTTAARVSLAALAAAVPPHGLAAPETAQGALSYEANRQAVSSTSVEQR